MGRKKKVKSNKSLKIIYVICVVIVIVAGLYYENGYTDVNKFINDITRNFTEITETVSNNIKETLDDDNRTSESVKSKTVTGKLEMHMIDVGQRR